MKNCDILDIFARVHVRTSTQSLCFRAKIRKTGLPVKTPVLLYKMGYEGSTLHGHVRMMHSAIIDAMQAKWGTLLCDIAGVYYFETDLYITSVTETA